MKNNSNPSTSKFLVKTLAVWHWIRDVKAAIISSGLGLIIFYVLNSRIVLTVEKKESILNLIVSIVSITAAILITYLFSKLFAERQERTNRKIQIDKLSFRLNELRNIAYCLRNEPQIWNQYSDTRRLDAEMPKLTVFQFRGDGNEYVGFEKFTEISETYGGSVRVQSYLSLRELASNEIAAHIDPLYVRDYTFDELGRYVECARHVSYFLNEYKENIALTDSYKAVHVDSILESYFYLTGVKLDIPEAIPRLSTLFSNMAETDLRKLEYFSHLNTRKLSLATRLVWKNLVVYVFILMFALIQNILLEPSFGTYVICLVSWFIGNTCSLAITIGGALKSELEITEYATLDKADAQTKQGNV